MSYNATAKRATEKYIKDKQQEIRIRYKKDVYSEEILPAISRSGLPVATFIKQAVAEKIRNEADKAGDASDEIEAVKNAVVREISTAFRDDCRKIILYGSYARGDYTDDSDVDIAILTNSDRNQVKKYNSLIDDVAAQIGTDTMAVVNFVCLPLAEYEEKKSWYPYFMNIARDGVILYEC